MHIQSITLENFRCFEKLSLELHPRLNVFFGENGSGKSSIFEAINILLGNIIDKLGKNSAVKTVISYEDIRNASMESSIKIAMHDGKLINWSLHGEKTIKNGDFSTNTFFSCTQLEAYIKNIINNMLSAKNIQNLPVFISYKSTRHTECFYAKNESPYVLSLNSCYDDAICMNFDYSTFFKWFKAREDLELQKNKKDTTYADKELQAVRMAIKEFCGFSNFSFDREVWKFVVEKNDEQIFYSQLSDGERGYILLVADIARRLAIANPGLKNSLEGEGVILIDEIELHLHPKWQRNIIPGLRRTFPNCQFIVSSHSPQVLGEIEDTNSIWILEQGQEPYHPSRAFGMESSELLREVMGAESRNAGVSTALEEIDRLIESGQFEKARSDIKELAQKTGEIPAIISANSYLTMMGQEQAEIEE